MKRIYFIYVSIPELIFNKAKFIIAKTERFRSKKGKTFGLYAWTTDKNILGEFLEVRNNEIYSITKKEIEKDEFKTVKSEYPSQELKRYKYYLDDSEDDKKSIDIVSTKFEYINSTVDGQENIYEFGPNVYEDAPYQIFNDEIIEALDFLGYTDKYDLTYGDGDRIDQVSYNNSFGLTALEKNKRIKFDNQMNILLYLYRFFFYGNDNIKPSTQED